MAEGENLFDRINRIDRKKQFFAFPEERQKELSSDFASSAEQALIAGGSTPSVILRLDRGIQWFQTPGMRNNRLPETFTAAV